MLLASTPHRKLHPWMALACIGLLLTLAWIGMQRTKAPAALGTAEAADAFSGTRAMQQLRRIARVPHPMGTREHDEVRDMLVTELKTLGLNPSVQPQFGVSRQEGSAAEVSNIVAEISGSGKGSTGAKALLLTAHYDSVPNGQGAADDGASVAAILETIRVLKAGPLLKNDVIVVFTDGEEGGLLGAEALLQTGRIQQHIGMVLNFDFRGNSGPILMYETSPNNGKLITGLADAVAQPHANSLMYEIYRRMPNDTDLTVFLRAGIPGMNFAAIENVASYHSDLDRPELMSPDTLQHEGDIMLAMTRHFGNQSLNDLAAPNQVYFDCVGLGLVHYPASWVLPLTALAVLSFGATVFLGRKTVGLRLDRTAFGATAFLIVSVVAASGCHMAWIAIRSLFPAVHVMLEPYNSGWYWLAFAALAVALFVILQSALKRWISGWEMGFGAALVWCLLLIGTTIEMPGATFLLLWPLLAVLFSWLATFSRWGRTLSIGRNTLLLVLGAAPGMILFAPQIDMLALGLGTSMIAVPILFLALLLGLLAPLSSTLAQRFVLPGFAFAAVFTSLTGAALTAGFDAEHPSPDSLFYTKNAASGKAYWLSSDRILDSWTQSYFPGETHRRAVLELFDSPSLKFWASPAPDVNLPAPTIEVLRDETAAGVRTLTIHAKTLRNAARMLIEVKGVDVLASNVGMQPYTTESQSDWALEAYPGRNASIDFNLIVPADKPFRIEVKDFSYGLTALTVPARPAEKMRDPFSGSDTISIINRLEIK